MKYLLLQLLEEEKRKFKLICSIKGISMRKMGRKLIVEFTNEKISKVGAGQLEKLLNQIK